MEDMAEGYTEFAGEDQRGSRELCLSPWVEWHWHFIGRLLLDRIYDARNERPRFCGQSDYVAEGFTFLPNRLSFESARQDVCVEVAVGKIVRAVVTSSLVAPLYREHRNRSSADQQRRKGRVFGRINDGGRKVCGCFGVAVGFGV